MVLAFDNNRKITTERSKARYSVEVKSAVNAAQCLLVSDLETVELTPGLSEKRHHHSLEIRWSHLKPAG
jgi:hypothetical protein